MPEYGEIRVDYITYTTGTSPNEGQGTVTVSGLINNPTFSGNVIIANDLTVSGKGIFASGTESTPSITFIDDLNTGIYSPAANELAISTSGTGRLFIDDSGNVGIGTASPNTELEVNGTAEALTLQGFDCAQGVSSLALRALGSGANNGFLQNDYTEISFNNRRTSDGTVSTNARIRSIAESDQTNSWPTSLGFYVKRFSSDFQSFRLESTGAAVFQGSSSEFARIDSSGRLLVGISTATDVAGNFGSTSGSNIQVVANSSFAAYSAISKKNDTSGPLLALASSRSDAIVQADDRLGEIRFAGYDGTDYQTNAALIKVEVDGTPGANDMPGRLVFATTADGASSPTVRMVIKSSGNVGIGTVDPGAELEVVATSPTIQARATANNVARLSLDSNRAASVLTGQIDGKWNGNTVSRINFVNGADGVNKDDGLITFNTSSSNSNPQERMRIDSNGRLLVGTSSSYNIGGGSAAKTQIVEQGGALTLSLTNYVNGSSGAYLALGASRGSTSGDFTILQSGDRLGQIRFAGADGVDLTSIGAEIKAEVDGTPGSNDMPGRLVFSTTADGASFPTQRMRIDSNGNVGIGTIDPATTLHVENNLDNPIQFSLSSSQTGASSRLGVGSTGNSIAVFADNTVLEGRDGGLALGVSGNNAIRFYNTSGRTERMRIDSSGRLLVGTFSTFSIESIITPQIISASANGAGSCADLFVGSFQNAGGSGRGRVSGKLFLGHSRSDTSGSIGGAVGNNDRLGEVRFVGDDGSSFLTAAEIIADVDGTPGTNDMPGRLVFSTTADGASSPTERMRIKSNGNVGIGTSDPKGLLDLRKVNATGEGATIAIRNTGSGIGTSVGLYLTPNNGGGDDLLRSAAIKSRQTLSGNYADLGFFTANSDTPVERMTIAPNGNVLIGKTVDSVTEGGLTLTASGFTRIVRDNDVPLILQRLNTDGNIQVFRRDNANVGSISVTTTATAYNTSSDYRLKENVVPMTGAADRVKALKPSRFNFIADPDTTVDGFLAHEAQEIVPESVTGEKDGEEMQGIDQSKLVPLLTGALQEALAKIEALEQRLNDAGL